MIPMLLSLFLGGAPEAPKLKIVPDGGLRHPSAVRAVAITPDSRTAFVGLNDGALLAFDLPSRKPIPVGFRAYGILFDLAVSPRGDRLAVVDGDGDVTLLDTATFKSVARVTMKADPEHVVFHPNGDALYVARADGHLLKLRAADLSTEKDIFPTPGSRVLALACSCDGDTVATSDRDGQIKLWSASDLRHRKTWKAHDVLARSLAFTPDGKHLISGGEEAAVKLWRLSDFALVKETKEYHQLSVECIACAPDGRLVTGGYDGLCQFWKGTDLDGIKSYPNYRGFITACAVSPDGKWLVRGGSVLDFVPMDRPDDHERVAEYGGAIMGMAVAPDLKRLATGGLDRRLIVWTIGKGIASKSALLDDWITAVAYCRDGQSIAVALANGKVEVYAAGTLEREASWPGHRGRVTGLAEVDGRLVSAGEDGLVHVWDLTGRRLRSVDEKAPCRALAVRGGLFAIGTANGTISVYDAATEAPVKRLRGRPLSVTALGFSTGGTRLMAGYFDGGLESLDTTAWTVVHFRPGDGASVLSIDANAKNDWVAVGFRDGRARLLDVVTLREGANVQVRPAREIFAIRWALGENSFAAAGASNGIAFYRTQPLTGGAALLDVQDRLTTASSRDRVRTGSYSKVFTATLQQGQTYVIDLMSSELDPYLRVEDASGNPLGEDDDSGGFPNARLVFRAPHSGTFRLIATTYAANATGPFHLRVAPR